MKGRNSLDRRLLATIAARGRSPDITLAVFMKPGE